jgi:hypothetical protein
MLLICDVPSADRAAMSSARLEMLLDAGKGMQALALDGA